MSASKSVWLAAAAVSLSGCAAGALQEDAALRAPRPAPPSIEVNAYAAPQQDYPTVGGDILKGTSPADLAAAREATIRPLAPDPGDADHAPN